MALNGYGGEKRGPQGRDVPPVTLATVALDDIDIELEAKEAAERVSIRRTIREGLDCWQQIGKTASLSAWYKIGRALSIGKAHALKVTGANAAWGQNYSREFGTWMKAHGFAQCQRQRDHGPSHCMRIRRPLSAGEQACPSGNASGLKVRSPWYDAGRKKHGYRSVTANVHRT